MRTRFLIRSVLALWLGGWAGHFTAAHAAEVNIFPVNHSWRYRAATSGTLCLSGTGWETTGYDDSTWLSGPGGFTGGETTAGTVASLAGLLGTSSLPAPTANSASPQYFRTHFTIADDTDLYLVLSNRVDDSCVIYINGIRVADIRYVTDPVVCTTLGLASVNGEATTWDVVTLSPAQLSGVLVTGDNVLAVSVHQDKTTSSDMVFVCSLTGVTSPPPPPPPISFTNSAGPITFDMAPPAPQWSTRGWAGGAGGVTDTPALVDTDVQLLDVATINAGLNGAAGNPPVSGGAAQYASDAGAHYVLTGPSNTRGDLLMATLTNNSGGSLGGLALSYTLTVTAPVVEEVRGHLVYYSLSGTPNSWVQIPDLSNQPTDNTAGAHAKTAILDLSGTPWAADTKMYFLWVDDNGSGSPDGALAIDDVKWSLPAPPHITSCVGFTNQTVMQCRASATLSVVAEGGLYQWVHDGNDIPGANGPSFFIPNMQPADAGQYTVRVYNNLGSTSCPPVTISLSPDTVLPAFVRGIVSTNRLQITLTFDRALDTNNLASVQSSSLLYDTNTDGIIPINSLVASNSVTLILQAGMPLDPTHGHAMLLAELKDACSGTTVPTTTVYLHGIRTQLLPFNALWRYDDTTDVSPFPANWADPGYNDGVAPWKSGPGPFDAKRVGTGTDPYGAGPGNCRTNGLIYPNYGITTNIGTCIALSNAVNSTNITTANFRAHFNYPGAPGSAILEVSGKFDDGALIYLNGAELQRVRMATGAVTRATFSNAGVNDGDATDYFQYLTTPLVNGDNVVAVELHQANLTSSDFTMGLQVVALTTGALAELPRLSIVIMPNGNVEVSWTGNAGTLISSSDLSNWAPVAGATNPYIIPAGTLANRRFYAVQAP